MKQCDYRTHILTWQDAGLEERMGLPLTKHHVALANISWLILLHIVHGPLELGALSMLSSIIFVPLYVEFGKFTY